MLVALLLLSFYDLLFASEEATPKVGVLSSLGPSPGPPPPTPVLPSSWHAKVSFVNEGIVPFESSLAVSYEGDYYYDYEDGEGVVAFVLRNAVSGHHYREVVKNNRVYRVDQATGSCSVLDAGTSERYQILPPDFLSSQKFQYLGKEYFATAPSSVFFETYHYQKIGVVNRTFNYYHGVDMDSPFRFVIGDFSPIIIEFGENIFGFSDVPNLSSIFEIPSHCTPASENSRITKLKTQIRAAEHGLKQEGVKDIIGSPWPKQWTGTSAYTGNNFGLVQKLRNILGTDFSDFYDVPEIGEPSTVSISLAGHYYYDWLGMRECNFWVDQVSGERTKTLIVNGTYYLVTLGTGSCEIVPIKPVGGPLKFDWPTRIPYFDGQWIRRESNYLRTNHFLLDVLNTGTTEHCFNYWERTDNHTPLQFQGPVLDFPPYGQSMMVWGEVQGSLEGLDLDYIFSVPKNCVPILMEDFQTRRIASFVNFHLNLLKLFAK